MNLSRYSVFTGLILAGLIGGFFLRGAVIPALPAVSPTGLLPAKILPESVSTKTAPVAGDLVRVTRVIDGDTIELANGEKVRYIGINSPESADPRKPVQCFGAEASAANKKLVEGKLVRLEKDISERDKYGRLLRYVYLGDVMVNQKLVAEGYAQVSTYPPDVKYQNIFLAAEKSARAAGKGLWSACKATASSQIITPAASSSYASSDSCNIKGNISAGGEKIYHLPDCPYYNQTKIDAARGEKWFCSESEALSAGWRKAQNCP